MSNTPFILSLLHRRFHCVITANVNFILQYHYSINLQKIKVNYLFREVLHGNVISFEEWRKAFGVEADPYEVNFIILLENVPAAWLKINGLNSKSICISMLVVDNSYKRRGIGSFAVKFAEVYAKNNGKIIIRIRTTKDNNAAIQCYMKQGYKILREMRYAVGDGIERDGYEFQKLISRSSITINTRYDPISK